MISTIYIHKCDIYLKDSNNGATKLNKNDFWKKILTFGILFVLIGVGVAPASLISKSTGKASNCDIPTWYEGDEWTYTADPVYYSGENGSFSGIIENLKNKVLNITSIVHDGVQYKVYEIEITGDISGDFSFNELSGDLDGEITGTTFIRISDLAQIKTEILTEGTIEIFFVDLDYEANFGINFFPPLELYDFPLNVGEQWGISCELISSGTFSLEGLINESFSGSQWVNETMYCVQKEDVSVPAGVFECYKLNHTDNAAWYSPDVGNSVKSIVDMSDENTTFFATLSLESFSRSTQPITITLNIDPSEAFLGGTVNISGQATEPGTGNPLQNADISIEIPSTGDSWVTTTNSDGYYSETIATPEITDDTPSAGEIGSGGVIVQCLLPPLHGIRVKTLVIIENTPPDKPTITGSTSGKAGTEYEYTLTSTDPDCNTVCLYIDWGDGDIEEWIGPYTSGTDVKVKHTWNVEGTYMIKAKAKDIHGEESDWITLEVTMPMNQQSINILFLRLERLLEHFPILEQILSSIPVLNKILTF